MRPLVCDELVTPLPHGSSRVEPPRRANKFLGQDTIQKLLAERKKVWPSTLSYVCRKVEVEVFSTIKSILFPACERRDKTSFGTCTDTHAKSEFLASISFVATAGKVRMDRKNLPFPVPGHILYISYISANI